MFRAAVLSSPSPAHEFYQPRRQPCAGGKPPRLDGPSHRLVDLRGQRRPSSTINVDWEGGHPTVVPPELQILVLFYDQGGMHLFARRIYHTQGGGR